MRSDRPTHIARMAILTTLALLLLAGCGSRVSGLYVSTHNPKDRIEFVSGSKARVTVLKGRNLDVWNYGMAGGATSDAFASQIRQAREALAVYETVEATYEFTGTGTIRFEAPGRGSRSVRIDEAGSRIEDVLGRGPYFRRGS